MRTTQHAQQYGSAGWTQERMYTDQFETPGPNQSAGTGGMFSWTFARTPGPDSRLNIRTDSGTLAVTLA